MQEIWQWWRGLARRYQVISGVLLGLVIVGIGWWGLGRSPAEPAPLPPASPPVARTASAKAAPQTTGTSSAASTSSTAETVVFVDVQGAVVRPGMYQFKAGMRVADAVKAAGGLRGHADRQRINLAQRLVDQQQLYLPKRGEQAPSPTGNVPATGVAPTQPASGASGGQSSSGTASVNLNTATVTDLQQLSGVGAKKAQKIIDYRTAHGDFKQVDDLTQIAGFGEKTVARLRSQLRVS